MHEFRGAISAKDASVQAINSNRALMRHQTFENRAPSEARPAQGLRIILSLSFTRTDNTHGAHVSRVQFTRFFSVFVRRGFRWQAAAGAGPLLFFQKNFPRGETWSN